MVTLMAVMVVEMDKKNVFFILLLFGIFMTKMIKTNMMKIAKMEETRRLEQIINSGEKE